MAEELKVVIGIMRAGNLIVDDLKKTLKKYPINATEFSVLEFLYSKGEKNIQEIRERVLLASGSATYVVDNLCKKNYVVRDIYKEDKRITYVRLTEQGRNLMNKLFPIHKENTKKLFSKLTKEEVQILRSLLKKIN